MDLSSRPLENLVEECEQQLQRFRLARERDSSSCTEILRRAAHHHEEAINTLLRVSAPLARAKCPAYLRDELEDWLQEVLLLLACKLRNRDSPYTVRPPPPDPFAAYRTYITVTARHYSIQFSKVRQRQQVPESLDRLQDLAGYEPAQPGSGAAQVERMMVLERLLQLIRKPLDREIFRLRFARGLEPAEIVQLLERQGLPGCRKEDVFRSVERMIRMLSTLPEVREMFESEAGIE